MEGLNFKVRKQFFGLQSSFGKVKIESVLLIFVVLISQPKN